MRFSRRAGAISAVLVSAALVFTACGTSTPGTSVAATSAAPSTAATTAAAEKVTLTVATFNEFGYDNLYAEYTKAHPNVTIVPKRAATSQEAKDNLNTRLAAGSGASDIEAIEVDWLPDLLGNPDKFADLKNADVAGRWLDWKEKAATSADGKLLGYGTDIGPEAVCYRADLFKKAGLPTDRAEVAKLLTGGWDTYFNVGKQFIAKLPGTAWFDSAGATYQAMVNQIANPYSSTTGTETLIPLDENKQIKDMYNQVLTASTTDKLSAGLAQWSPDWTKAFQGDKFATMMCPGWMLGVISGNAAGVKGWDIADVFPGGGGNWGGSYLTVPAMGKHTEAARELAAWLTAPEQQIKAFMAKGTFPSQVKALDDPALLTATNAFFNNAPTGQILSNRAKAIPLQPYKGPNYFAIMTMIGDALNRVDVDKTSNAAASWAKALEEFKGLK